ncbi:hypothetical protein [Rhabdothermincola salaria]|uniref:hypothetical protein n=1 Tax=Rhabdothermincola salaria TaxID=2903142 RepID=UPI001E4363C3|nr:hypothetical protein [Rhabdothermincola salaria]MCD9624254.1 hypothetical protein [Rhabdothermincola salaria]
MGEFFLPRTDGGVYVQAVAALILFAGALWLARRNRDALTFVAGAAVLTVGLMGLRLLH